MKKSLFILFAILALAIPQKALAGWSDYVIILDPGHGGPDCGATYDGGALGYHAYESWLVMNCAANVYNKLVARGAHVYPTRELDNDDIPEEVELSPRRAYCYTYDSDIFVSFHLNAANASAHGTETYYSYDYSSSSSSFAYTMQSALVEGKYGFASVNGRSSSYGKYELIDRGVKTANYSVIIAGEPYPSILTEGLFIDYVGDWQLIHSADTADPGFSAWVDGHLNGIYNYLYYYGNLTASDETDLYYNGTGGGGVSSTPQISLSSTQVELSCPLGQSVSTSVVAEGVGLNRWTTVTLSEAAKEIGVSFDILPINKGGLNVSGETHAFDIINDNGETLTTKPEIKITFKPNSVGTWKGENTSVGYSSPYYIKFESLDVNGNKINAWINLDLISTNPPLSLTEVWNKSQMRGTDVVEGKYYNKPTVSFTYDAKAIRNMEYYDDRLFCVYDQSRIRVLSARDDARLLYDLNTTGVDGGTVLLADVKQFDGKIIASNIVTNGSSQDLKIYIWNDTWDDPNPYDQSNNPPTVVTIPSSVLTANGITRIGDYIEADGTWSSGNIYFGFNTTTTYTNSSGAQVTGNQTRVIKFSVSNSAVNTTSPTVEEFYSSDGTTPFYAGTSARVTPTTFPSGAVGYMVCGTACTPTKVVNGKVVDYMMNYEKYGNTYREFLYKEDDITNTYAFMLDYAPVSVANDGVTILSDSKFLGGHMKLLKIMNGTLNNPVNWDVIFKQPEDLASMPSDGLSSDNQNGNGTGNICVNTDNGSYLEAWVLCTNQGIAYYRSGKELGTGVEGTFSDEAVEKEVKSVEYVNMMGQRSLKPFEGVNIVVTTFTDGTTKAIKTIK